MVERQTVNLNDKGSNPFHDVHIYLFKEKRPMKVNLVIEIDSSILTKIINDELGRKYTISEVLKMFNDNLSYLSKNIIEYRLESDNLEYFLAQLLFSQIPS